MTAEEEESRRPSGRQAATNVVLSAADVIISTHSHDVICRGDLFARTQRKGEARGTGGTIDIITV